MHIKPDNLTSWPAAATPAPRRLDEPKSTFQQALQSAVGEPAAALPESPAELVAALRHRMLQNAIELGDAGAAEETFSPYSRLADLASEKYFPASQKIDMSRIPATSSRAMAAYTHQPPAGPSIPVMPDIITIPAIASRTPLPVVAIRSSPPAQNSAVATLPDIIARASARYQVAPEIIQAVIRAESGFNPKATSPAGAQGLMQLMPGTARELGVSDPYNPEQNVMAGTRYLKQMLGRYGGDLEKALAAYNWGPGNLDRSHDGRLPQETRRYIARIKDFLTGSG